VEISNVNITDSDESSSELKVSEKSTMIIDVQTDESNEIGGYFHAIQYVCEFEGSNYKIYLTLDKDTSKVELKVASIGHKNIVVFNQLHFGETREVDKFLFAIIKPDNEIDFFVVPKEDFIQGKIKVQKQHSTDANTCARLCWPYNRMVKELSDYRVEIDNLSKNL
jgi:hypothetical protein